MVPSIIAPCSDGASVELRDRLVGRSLTDTVRKGSRITQPGHVSPDLPIKVRLGCRQPPAEPEPILAVLLPAEDPEQAVPRPPLGQCGGLKVHVTLASFQTRRAGC